VAVLHILRQGHRVFSQGAKPVTEITDDVRKLIDDMVETMRRSETPGVGLAAPQVGHPLAIIVAEPPPDHEGTEALYEGAIVLMNPEVVYSSGSDVIEEGCLSCPGITAEVERPRRVVVKGMDRDGREVKLEVSGALARIFQHEIDHLHGKFFFDHLNPLRRQLLKSRIRRT